MYISTPADTVDKHPQQSREQAVKVDGHLPTYSRPLLLPLLYRNWPNYQKKMPQVTNMG
jgi:hypothetical protein